MCVCVCVCVFVCVSYGDLSVPTGTYDAIRTLLKDTKRVKRKSLK